MKEFLRQIRIMDIRRQVKASHEQGHAVLPEDGVQPYDVRPQMLHDMVVFEARKRVVR